MRFVAVVSVVILLVLVLVGVYAFSGTTYDSQTRQYEQELLDVLKLNNEDECLRALKELAKRVGAGTENTIIGTPVRIDSNTILRPQTPITESKLVENIQYAFQTRNSHSAALVAKKGNYIAFGALLATSILAVVGLAYSRRTHISSEQRDTERFKIERDQEASRKLEKQKANISVKLEHMKRGYYVLKLQNDGAAEARAVTVSLNDVELLSVDGVQPNDPTPLLIGSRSSFSYHWPTGKGPRPPFNVEVRWFDDSAETGIYNTTLVHPTNSI